MTTPEKMLEVSTRDHQMTVLRDDGLYRHVQFAKPGTGIWRFDLVTWPGHLVITGDLEDFHFARIPDMFEFFRKPVGYINPSYWSEKLCGPQRYDSFSPDVFKRHVYEYFRDWCRWNAGPHDGPHAPLWKAIRDQVLRYTDDHNETSAHQVLTDFHYGDFEFVDSWEWDLKDYDFHFLLSLHAIVWGINRYDAAKTAAA
ncbi:hypothetical protein [Mycobacteroides abscessus]|uniref:hypothetical protein n=1 Tax=Mycobacteroides abscessus TaxID=36809 RepID=UPI000929A27C|nr:hypothetical protein [Mycobacteroides abscessus]QST90606.1 hypothetical protein PROPHIGD52-1_20 [Mycobacterium phage prophi52-1]MBN7332416.1 hypothetical protein [Mycobacteroides abscessus subsp. abscessus]SHX23181.1 Uncharacterised protein [Mycobacteroides abscessus subsp. abscessus]SHY14454.1 Uncharacterised protein [Mycobacteroides abscessus subsp. abscessus]SIA42112.1 Uncharacterised protein [Mycobacteroides abscessus subsp. abscessus]